MNCEEYFHLISGHMDGCNSDIEEKHLQQHLECCEGCRTLLAQLQENEQLLAHSTVTPPADLTKRIMKAVRKEPKKKSKKRFFTSLATAGLATAALLALVFFGSNGLPQLATVDSAAEVAMDEPYAMEDRNPAEQATGNGSDDFSQSAAGEESIYLAESATAAPDSKKHQGEQSTAPSQENPQSTLSETWVLSDEAPYSMDLPYRYGTTSPGSSPAIGRSGIYGIHAADGELRELPTLVIYGASPEDFPSLSLQPPLPSQLPSMQTANIAVDGSFYQRFFSVLPSEFGLLSNFPSEPDFNLSRYSVSYESFSALLDSVIGRYEAAIYLPEEIDEEEDCLIILISEEIPE